MRAASIGSATRIASAGNGIGIKQPFAYSILSEQIFTSASQFTKEAGGTAVLSTSSATPLPPGQTSYVHATNNGYAGSNYSFAFNGPWDFSDCFFRFMVRCQVYGLTQGYFIRFATNASTYAAGNYLSIKIAPGSAAPNWLPLSTWVWDGFDPLLMSTVGTGASLSSIGFIGFASQDASSSQTNDWDFARMQRVQKAGLKAKCVIWHDDSVASGYSAIKSKLDGYGWAGTEANEWGAMDTGPTFIGAADLVTAKAAGWHIGTHAFTPPEHTGVTEAQFANQLYRAKVFAAKYNLAADAVDFAYWGGLAANYAYPQLQRMSRSGRGYTSQLQQPETQPPCDPHIMKAFGADANQTFATNWKPIIQNAITTKGIAQLVFHQQIGSDSTQAAEFDAMLAWLDQNRDSIDVVSFGAAIAPLLVGYVPPVITAPTAMTLSATPGNGQNTISKTGGLGTGVTYKLYRGTSATGTPIATSFPYTDTGLTNGTAVSYIATATNSAGTTTSNTISATPAAPPVTRADNFERANSTTSLGTASDSATAADGGVWTILAGTWGIQGGQAYNAGNASGGQAVRDIGTPNHSVQSPYTVSGGNSIVLIARCTDINNWYGLLAGASSGQVYKRVGGTVTAIGSSLTVAAGDTLKLSVSGTTITVSRNGSTIATITDTGLSTGNKVGMRADSAFGYFGDFLATAL